MWRFAWPASRQHGRESAQGFRQCSTVRRWLGILGVARKTRLAPEPLRVWPLGAWDRTQNALGLVPTKSPHQLAIAPRSKETSHWPASRTRNSSPLSSCPFVRAGPSTSTTTATGPANASVDLRPPPPSTPHHAFNIASARWTAPDVGHVVRALLARLCCRRVDFRYQLRDHWPCPRPLADMVGRRHV